MAFQACSGAHACMCLHTQLAPTDIAFAMTKPYAIKSNGTQGANVQMLYSQCTRTIANCKHAKCQVPSAQNGAIHQGDVARALSTH